MTNSFSAKISPHNISRKILTLLYNFNFNLYKPCIINRSPLFNNCISGSDHIYKPCQAVMFYNLLHLGPCI